MNATATDAAPDVEPRVSPSATGGVVRSTHSRDTPWYDAVTTKAGRYVQGGGFGSFSKAFGLAAASLPLNSKVFCFFFSKKKYFLPSCSESPPRANLPQWRTSQSS